MLKIPKTELDNPFLIWKHLHRTSLISCEYTMLPCGNVSSRFWNVLPFEVRIKSLTPLSVSAKTFCLTALLYTALKTLNEVARLLLLLPLRGMYASKSCRNCKSTCSNLFFPRLHCSKRLLQVSYLDAGPTLPTLLDILSVAGSIRKLCSLWYLLFCPNRVSKFTSASSASSRCIFFSTSSLFAVICICMASESGYVETICCSESSHTSRGSVIPVEI